MTRTTFVAVMLTTSLLLSACQLNFGGGGGGDEAPKIVQVLEQATPVPLPTRAVSSRTAVTADGALVLTTPLAAVAFETNAKVTKINVRPGQAVQVGEVLAEVDTDALNDALQQAQEQLRIRETDIAQNLAPPKDTDLASARASLNSAWARYNELKKGASQSDIDEALRGWNQAKNALYASQLSRDQACGFDASTPKEKRISSSEPHCKRAELSVQASEMSERQAFMRYQEAQKPPTKDKLLATWSDVVSAQGNLAKLQKGVSAEQKKIYDLQLAQAKLAVKRAERNLGKAKLMATCVCVVQDVNLNVGANSGGSGITLLNTSSLRFRTTNLSERDVVRMQLGQPATIRLKAFDQAFTGKVAAVLPLSSGAQNGAALYSVLIEVDVAGAGLLPGMTGQAEIEIGL